MMLFTHVLVGILVGVLVAAGQPNAGAVVAAGAFGGLLPDLDMFADHRRTLHYPVVFALLATVLGLAVVIGGSGGVVPDGFASGAFASGVAARAAFACVAAAAAHSAMDVLGSGREIRPWDRDSDCGVYNHAAGRWHAPRRWVYDGSPGDLALAGAVTLPILALADAPTARAGLALLGCAAVYTSLRRRLARWVPSEYESLSPYLKSRIGALRGGRRDG